MAPANSGQIVDHRFWQVPLLSKIANLHAAVALAQLALAGGRQDQRQVGVYGYFPTERVVEQYVLWHRRKPLVATHDVADLHQMVVHHIGQMVGGKTIALQKHQIVQRLVLESDRAVQHVLKRSLALQRCLQSDHRCDSLGRVFGTLAGAEIATMAVVADSLLLRALFLAQRVQPLRRAVAVVGLVFLHQPVGIVLVQVQSL